MHIIKRLWGLLQKIKSPNISHSDSNKLQYAFANERLIENTGYEYRSYEEYQYYDSSLYDVMMTNHSLDMASSPSANNVSFHETTTESMSIRQMNHPRMQVLMQKLNQECMEKLNNLVPINKDGPFCNRTLDRFGGCWPDTLPGQFAQIPCPDIFSFNRKAFAYRECTENGTWFIKARTGKTWANYSMCKVRGSHVFEDDFKHVYIFIGGFCLSLVMLIISLGIFFRFRQLRCDRITIHKNLFLSYVFTGISWTLYYVLAGLDGDVMLNNPVWCQILHVMCQYFTVCNFLWMFCEGLYLNTIMVYAFSSGKILIIACYIIGWGLPVILTVAYGVVRSSDNTATVDCWMTDSSLIWIMYGPIVISIGINVLFLINIVRLLITKLRQMPEADQTKKATRATLILVPLLGLQYLLFPIRPENNKVLEEVYHITIALLGSLQGAFVSLMYCFCNSEVIQILRRKWNQHRLMSRSSMRASQHATTYTTTDPVSQGNTTYFSTADTKDPPIKLTLVDNDGKK